MKVPVVKNKIYEDIHQFRHQLCQLLYIDRLSTKQAKEVFDKLFDFLNATRNTEFTNLRWVNNHPTLLRTDLAVLRSVEQWHTRIRLLNQDKKGMNADQLMMFYQEIEQQELWYQDPDSCYFLELPVTCPAGYLAMEHFEPISLEQSGSVLRRPNLCLQLSMLIKIPIRPSKYPPRSRHGKEAQRRDHQAKSGIPLK